MRLPFGARARGYAIDGTGQVRMPMTDENRVDTGVRHVADVLANSPELNRLTCSREERANAIHLLEKYVEDTPNPDSTLNYSKKETLDLIKAAINGRGPRLSRS